jgi:hypothetical protein
VSVPISLIVDDGAPVNPAYWLHPDERHVHLIPNSVARDFGDTCRRYGAAGKFSVLPMPAQLGRIDQGLNHVPARHLHAFLRIARESIAPRFDITCELLTHQAAVNLATGRYLHMFEDEWVSRAGVAEMTDYISLGLRILKNVGLPANGVTSPWSAGIDNERRYAEAIARAQWRVHRRKFAWYFLHCLGRGKPRWPWIVWQDKSTGLKAVTVPANTDDVFWATQHAGSSRAARDAAWAGVDRLLSGDGRGGKLRGLFRGGHPMVILTHWQSLFSNGRCAGLRGLERLLGRIARIFGAEVRWMRCSELARAAVARKPG